ncbi:MAG TPA: 50S ribosomal protein L23 [Patescibacteria group bacterium]|nr:50S ribosomal protein L23 [Patescibacteria group bacterium]
MSLIITPRMSEKTYALVAAENTYVFNVPLGANKIEVKKEVESLYSVRVEGVKIVRMIGKTKQSNKKRSRPTIGKRSDFKKAYVTVKKGQTIPVFTTPEEEKK